MMLNTLVYIILYALLNVSGAALIKWQLRGRQLGNLHEWTTFMLSFYFVLAFALIVLSALSLFKALSSNSFSLIIPIATGLNFMFTVFLGYWLFRDKFSSFSFVGFLFILVGIVILSLNHQIHAQQNLSK